MLPKTGFLSHASAELHDTLTALATEIVLEVGEVLFEQGDDGDALFAVVDGLLEVSVLSEDGRKLALDVMREGAMLGEIALFDPGVRTATATALRRTTLLKIRNADILGAIRRMPELGVDLIHLAGQRMRWMSRQISEQAFLPMSTRLARKILHLLGESTTENFLPMSQANVADFVGVTREAVSKTLGEWKRSGLVEVSRKGIRVTDRPSLETIAHLEFI